MMSLVELCLYFLKLGAMGFGGPIALAGRMESDLVDRRGWFSHDEYLEGLAFSQLAPGPLAAQLAIYLGWIKYDVFGATLVGFAFILPSFLIVLLIAKAYFLFGGGIAIQALFYGIGAAVIAIIVQSIHKLMKRVVGRDILLWAIFAINMIITAWTKTEIIWLFVLSGLLVMLIQMSREWSQKAAIRSFAPLAILFRLRTEYADSKLLKMFLFFAKAGTFVFGSGLAIVPFLNGGVVHDYHWLTEKQFLDAIAVAMITPGPVVISVVFIGYLVAGFWGASVSALGVFAPVYVVVLLLAPHYHRFGQRPLVKSFVAGLTSAAIGGIAGAAIILGDKAFTDTPTIIIGIAALALLYWKKKIPEPILIAAAGIAGLLIKFW